MKTQEFFLMLIAFILISLTANAKVWRVNNDPTKTASCNDCFSQLQTAVNSTKVAPGDTVYLEASSTSYNSANITKRLTVIGTGYFLTLNTGLQANANYANIDGIDISSGADGTKLSGVALSYPGNMEIKANDVKLERCYFYGSIDIVSPNGGLKNLLISQCYIRGSISSYYSGSNLITNLIITNNYIGNTIYLYKNTNNSSGTVKYNVVQNGVTGSNNIDYYNNIFRSTFTEEDNSPSNVYNNIFTSTVPSWLTSSSNIYEASATVFQATGTTDGILQLNPSTICSQCYTGYVPSGPDTAQIGMFGGFTPYVLSGIPPIPTIYKLKGTNLSYPTDSLRIEIGTRSNN